jgi:predicted nucleotidyltransferase
MMGDTVMAENLETRIAKAAAALKAEGAREVYLFGSATTGMMRDDSDVDLAVAGLPPERFFRAMGLVGDALQHAFDLVDLDEGSLFTDHLKRKGKLRRVG